MLLKHLQKNYKSGEPIFLSELQLEEAALSESDIEWHLSILVASGLLKQFDQGIYYLPKQTSSPLGSHISIYPVLEKKYLRSEAGPCGYITGLLFANQLGLTTQVPMTLEVVSNKVETEQQTISIGKTPIVLRRPRTIITAQNHLALQFLDLMQNIDCYSELKPAECKKVLVSYLHRTRMRISELKEYMPLFPDKLFRCMFEVGLLILSEAE